MYYKLQCISHINLKLETSNLKLPGRGTPKPSIHTITFFNELKKTGAEFGYRSAAEMNRFAALAGALNADWSADAIMDVMIMQKLRQGNTQDSHCNSFFTIFATGSY